MMYRPSATADQYISSKHEVRIANKNATPLHMQEYADTHTFNNLMVLDSMFDIVVCTFRIQHIFFPVWCFLSNKLPMAPFTFTAKAFCRKWQSGHHFADYISIAFSWIKTFEL